MRRKIVDTLRNAETKMGFGDVKTMTFKWVEYRNGKMVRNGTCEFEEPNVHAKTTTFPDAGDPETRGLTTIKRCDGKVLTQEEYRYKEFVRRDSQVLPRWWDIIDVDPMFSGILFSADRYKSVEEVVVSPEERKRAGAFAGGKAYLLKSRTEDPDKAQCLRFETSFDPISGRLAKIAVFTNGGSRVFECHYLDYQMVDGTLSFPTKWRTTYFRKAGSHSEPYETLRVITEIRVTE
jgi:hypothetical protein